MLPLDEYLEKIRPELTKLMTNDYNVKLSVNVVFITKINPNNECYVFIESDNKTDVDEIFDELIKKCKSLRNINFIPKGFESVTYNFTKLIISNTFTDSPEWIKNAMIASAFNIQLLLLYIIKKLRTIQKEFQRLSP